VHTIVDFLDEDEEPDFEQLQQIHRNAQASSVLISSLEKDEFDRVNGLEKAKDMFDDENPQEMYNQLKKLVNKVRAYGSRRCGNRRVIDRMLWAYVIKDTTVISLIQQDPTFERMTPDDVLGKIINHEMLVEEAQFVKNLSKGIIFQENKTLHSKLARRERKL
jgi:hypothetical protein